MMRKSEHQKPVLWVGSSRKDIRALPEDVQDGIGKALLQAQRGGKASSAKPLQGYKGAAVLEVVEDHDGDAYRAAYTVRFPQAVYVLHVFQKKGVRGIQTPPRDIELIQSRLKIAEKHHADHYADAPDASPEAASPEAASSKAPPAPKPPRRKR